MYILISWCPYPWWKKSPHFPDRKNVDTFRGFVAELKMQLPYIKVLIELIEGATHKGDY